MNRKIMDGLSYGFYFIIICLIFLVVYLVFFKHDTKKQVENNGNSNDNTEIVNENIKLNKNEISLDIGGSFNLKVTLTPSSGKEKINYESENPSVATINEFGLISGISTGSTKILVSVEGTDLKEECKVIVTENVINVKELFVNSEKVNIKSGETYQLNVSVIPKNAVDKTLKYSSLNDSIVSVDENGLVTALKTGYARVVVESVASPDVKLEIGFVVK